MKNLFDAYRSFWGSDDKLYQIFSPYRICPIGAHVNHKHGLVSGFAFDKGIIFLFSTTEMELLKCVPSLLKVSQL